MSTRSKSAHEMAMERMRLLGRGTGRQRGERGPGVVVERDLAGCIALLGHALGAPLIETDAVAIAAPGEAGVGSVHRDREERAFQRVVANQASEIVAAPGGGAARAVDGDARD